MTILKCMNTVMILTTTMVRIREVASKAMRMGMHMDQDITSMGIMGMILISTTTTMTMTICGDGIVFGTDNASQHETVCHEYHPSLTTNSPLSVLGVSDVCFILDRGNNEQGDREYATCGSGQLCFPHPLHVIMSYYYYCFLLYSALL